VLTIDRLDVGIPGQSAEDGRRFARRLTDCLAAYGGLPASGDLPVMRIDLTADLRGDAPDLAEQVAAALLRHLREMGAGDGSAPSKKGGA
jgi:hypothetical protein